MGALGAEELMRMRIGLLQSTQQIRELFPHLACVDNFKIKLNNTEMCNNNMKKKSLKSDIR